jgi:hypothetical protein
MMGNEARTKEEALYSLVLELTAKVQKYGAEEDSGGLDNSSFGDESQQGTLDVLRSSLPA